LQRYDDTLRRFGQGMFLSSALLWGGTHGVASLH